MRLKVRKLRGKDRVAAKLITYTIVNIKITTDNETGTSEKELMKGLQKRISLSRLSRCINANNI